jgi:hypothetical protein
MKLFNLFFTVLLSVFWGTTYAQTCDASVAGSQDWSALGWSCASASAPITDGNTYVQTTTINSLGDGEVLTVDVSVTIDGDLNINANGNEPAFTVPAGITLRITGNLNSDKNNVLYTINGTLIVEGTITVKNGNQFAGSGTMQGGTLVLKNNNDCAGTCPTITFADCCENGGADCFPPGTASDFCTNNDPSGLPVDLLYFEAKAAQTAVQLKWATIQEIDNKHFIIQRSSDLFNWTDVDTIPGHGDHLGLLYYNATDTPTEQGQLYYRLQQQDFDGTTAYSSIAAVWWGTHNNTPRLSVYPNPAQNHLNVQLSGMSGNVHLQLMSALGTIKWQQTLSTETSGFLLKRISVTDLPSGMYILKVSTKQQVFQKKVVIE